MFPVAAPNTIGIIVDQSSKRRKDNRQKQTTAGRRVAPQRHRRTGREARVVLLK